MATLEDPLRLVIGDKAAKRLDQALGIRTVGELLMHYPRRYEERGELTELTSLRDGEHVTVQAEIAKVTVRKMRSRPGTILEATVTDGRGSLTLTFFGRGRQDWRERELLPGVRGLFSGQVSTFQGKRQLAHPDYELLGAGDPAARATEFASELIPVYRATKEISSWKIANSVEIALDVLDVPSDPLPAGVRGRYGLCGYADALRGIHRPVDRRDLDRARLRLKWDEAFALQVVLAQRRLAAAEYSATPRPLAPGGLLADFDAALPFELTVGQQLAGTTIADDLGREHPMHRLLQGEVGSGKTVIAVRAMLQVVDAAGQAVLLAPPEVLAQQHYRSISQLLGPLAQGGQLGGAEHATRLTLVTGSQGARVRKETLRDVRFGDAGIVIGTHALLYDRAKDDERVEFFDLGLVVVDEQHRFGVEQRDALRGKARDSRPHLLVMTATPIPRTVAMTVFGDLDILTLTELPAGRVPIQTHVVPAAEKPHYLARTWARLREEVEKSGGQAYIVCPRIGGDASESNNSDTTEDPAESSSTDAGAGLAELEDSAAAARPPHAVLDMAAELSSGPLAGLRLRIMHGRMAADEKDAVMREFADGSVDVLVATTVVEVGVDVPNATAMVIMDADRFGVS